MAKSDDPWSIASLDEDFVRGARVRELSAAERATEAQAFKKANRKARRWLGGRRALGLLVPLAVVGGIVALSTRQRPTEGLSAKTSPTTVLSSSPTNAPPVATTTVFGTTTVALDRRTYAIGECVRWEQESTTSRRNVQTVSCEATHLYEMVGMTVAPEAWTAGSFPPDPEIHRMIDAACRGLAERYLGSPLDPLGFLKLRAVYPLKQGWLTGDRQMGCALVRSIDRSDVAQVSKDLEVETVGSVRTSDQRFPWKIGDCLTYEKWTFRVPCEELHTYEFVGWGEFPTGSAQPFATDSTYGKSCDALVKTYQPEPTALIVLWDQVASESWAAGARSFPCFFTSAARGPDGWPAKQAGSVRVVTV